MRVSRNHLNLKGYGRKKTLRARGKRSLRVLAGLTALIFVAAAALAGLSLFEQPQSVKAATVGNTALKWTRQAPAGSTQWQNVIWVPELNKFVAVGLVGGFPVATEDKIMTSPDGKTWAIHSTDTNGFDPRNWMNAIAWSPELNRLVAVSCGTGPPAACNGNASTTFQTSPDGITWTGYTTPNDGYWESIVWSPALDLFVTVASGDASASGERVMTSPDGITWTLQTPAEVNAWNEVTWSPDLNLFVAVASSGTTRVMTSPDGINWTGRTAAAANSWKSVVWSPELDLFVAVSTDGANRAMTSSDGINWTIRTAPEDSAWQSITWSSELGKFVAVANSGTNKLMTSTDGVNWTPQPAASSNGWQSITWSPETDTYVAVANSGTNTTRVMTGAMITASTSSATSIGETAATLHGNYQDPFPGANVLFRYRIVGSSDPFTESTPQAVTSAGAFTASPSGLSDNTTYEFKAVVQWVSEGSTQELEGGLLTFTTLPADDDDDGSANPTEDACPNGGDANNDGTQDSTQAHVTCFENPVTSKTVVLEVNNACQNNTAAMKAEIANTAQDAGYDYPAGLMDFTTNCGTPGFTTTVKQYVYGAGADYVVRKFNTNTNTYSTIAGATLAHSTIDGQIVTTATYTVADGTELDMDGTANGTIIDPAGLALTAASGSNAGVPNTGLQAKPMGLYAVLALAGGICSGLLIRRLIKQYAEKTSTK